MKFKIEATQTIYKYIEVEADNENEAYEKADGMLADGIIRFDDEPFLKEECDIRVLRNI